MDNLSTEFVRAPARLHVRGGQTRGGQIRGQLRPVTGSAGARVHARVPRACRRVREVLRLHLHSGGKVAKEERRRNVHPPPLFALHIAHAAGWVSSPVLSWLLVLRAVRSSAARTAIAAGSSTRSGSPCLSRERRASSAPVLRIAARSSGLSGPRGGRRTSRLLALLHLTSSSGSGMALVLSVRGHHLPETTRRNGIASLPLLSKTTGVARISACHGPDQYHGVIKSLRNWQACQRALKRNAGG